MVDGIELRTAADKGEGVFATRSFRLGETVMVGRIDGEVDHNHPHASQVSEQRFVLHGGLIPKVNHSCEPNCGVRVNSGGAHDILARQPIAADEEITFDYAMRNYVVEYFPAECRCGSRRCRGRISGWRDLSAQRKADYHGYVARYLIDIDNRRATVRISPGLVVHRACPDRSGMNIQPPTRAISHHQVSRNRVLAHRAPRRW